MSERDYAIVVGISRYSRLGPDRTSLDLQGPDSDVDAVITWLRSPTGGAVPASNIRTIRCPTTAADGTFEPSQGAVEEALIWLRDLSDANLERGAGSSVGQRLYIYMSGHGFSALPDRACLYTAEARVDYGRNVHATGWLSWLQDAGLFRELVLWMDCCMDGVGWEPGDPAVRKATPKGAPGPSFIAFAAPRPLRAVERLASDDNGLWHGVFTSVLIEGLRGAAVDTNGRVTGRSLGDWLRASLAGRMSDSDRADFRIAKEPMVVRDDADLVFGRGLQPFTYPVNLVFSENAAGNVAQLWSGVPPTKVDTFPVVVGALRRFLRPGLYLIEVPASGLRQGFAVTGPTSVAIQDLGTPVQATSDQTMFLLKVVTPANGGHDIRVVDYRFVTADAANGSLDARLPFGLYKVRVSTGRTIQERVVLLDGDLPPFDSALVAQPSPAVAPISGTATAVLSQAAISEQARAAACAAAVDGQAVITVLARTYGGVEDAETASPLWSGGIEVVDAAGSTVTKLVITGTEAQIPGSDGCAAVSAPVPPGSYFLRYKVQGQPVEQSLVAVAGWSLDATLLFRRPRSGQPGDGFPRLSLLMRSMGNKQWDPAMDARAEAARLALVDERDVLSGPLGDALLTSFDDPMTGLMGAHLLLIANSQGTRDLAPLSGMIDKLKVMVGGSHPDVQALELSVMRQGAAAPPQILVPPMFARSWSLIISADARFDGLIPVDLWRRVRAQSSLAPYLVWATSEATQVSVSQDLTASLTRALLSAAARPAVTAAVAPVLAAAATTSADVLWWFRKSAVGEAILGHFNAFDADSVRSLLPAVGNAVGTTELLDKLRQRAKELGIPISAIEDLFGVLMTEQNLSLIEKS